MTKQTPILRHYVLREYLKIFSLSLGSLLLIYIIVLFFQKVDTFIKYDASFSLLLLYLLYKTPEVIFQWTLPYGVLLATLLTLGILSRNSEITAMKAGGISLYRITFPLFIVVFFLSLFSFFGNEYLVPITNHATRYLLSVKVRNEKEAGFFRNYKIWYRSQDHILNVQLLNPKKMILDGVTLYKIDDQFRCLQRIDANEAKWIDNKWIFRNGTVRIFDKEGSIQTLSFQEQEVPLTETWEAFQEIERRSQEMSYSELYTYIKKIRLAGYDPTRYLVELHSKLSFPLLNFIMLLIGIPFALKTGRSGGVALNIGISVMIGFTYGVIFYVFLSFGNSGVLPPVLAAWIPTILFGLTGIFILMSIKQ